MNRLKVSKHNLITLIQIRVPSPSVNQPWRLNDTKDSQRQSLKVARTALVTYMGGRRPLRTEKVYWALLMSSCRTLSVEGKIILLTPPVIEKSPDAKGAKIAKNLRCSRIFAIRPLQKCWRKKAWHCTIASDFSSIARASYSGCTFVPLTFILSWKLFPAINRVQRLSRDLYSWPA